MTPEQRDKAIEIVAENTLDSVKSLALGGEWKELDAWLRDIFDWNHMEDDALLMHLSDDQMEELGIE